MDVKEPVISIVIPVFNTEQYLNRCIESISNQTFSNIEIILVNDGSTDNSGRICDEWGEKDNRIRIYHQKNKGVTAARKHGVKMAVGDWIKFVDSDDYLPQNALLTLYSYVKKEIDIVGGLFKFIGNHSNTYHSFGEKNSIEYIKLLLRHKTDWGPCCRIIRKSILDDFVFDISRNVMIGEDLIMNLRIGQKATRILLVPDIVYFYVWRPESAMSKVSILDNNYKKNFNSEFRRSFSSKYQRLLKFDIFCFLIKRSLRFFKRKINNYIKNI